MWQEEKEISTKEISVIFKKGIPFLLKVIFIFKNNNWITPPISDGTLDGIIRGEILNMGKLDGAPIREESLTLAQVQEADYIFICNSLTGAVPVVEINGLPKEKSPAMQAISEIHKSEKVIDT